MNEHALINPDTKIITIGGSAGSFKTVLELLAVLPNQFSYTVVLCLHRLKTARFGMIDTMNQRLKHKIIEPFDKQFIESGKIYLAPANYHLFIKNGSFMLSNEEQINHARPSIDATFTSVADEYKNMAVGIILSGANYDGAAGLKAIKQNGGVAIVQNPENCEINIMPERCIALDSMTHILDIEQIKKIFQEK